MEKKWVIRKSADESKVRELSSELGIDPVLAELLVQRGVNTFEEARAFFRPSLERLHDPFLMKDMDKAVERVERALDGGEKILVYGDYDVDGTTAVSLVYSFLSRLTSNVGSYIPDRYDEGYGVSTKGIDWAVENGYSLIITLDCGIKAIERVRYAAEKGIDMIICDHHLPENELPAAVAVLDPKREDCHYPFDDLSGCGVGFKLVQAYAQSHGIAFESLEPLLDLLAVSIASDLVSVTGENRILAHFGLKRLNEDPCKGLKAMISLSGLEPGHLTIDDIVFKIGPRINAAGRMESGGVAVKLLTATDDKTAVEAAEEINRRRAAGGRVIAVGTTSCRVLESASDGDGVLHEMADDTGIFIYPGYKFKMTDALITNFHLPESTLLMLVSALWSREKMLDAYKLAVREGYRFFSFGDAMLIV